MNKLILFLLRKKLKVKKYQRFKFKNQANKDFYYFIDSKGIKKGESYCQIYHANHVACYSDISINFLLSNECQDLIERADMYE